jgi:hypothetical protein
LRPSSILFFSREPCHADVPNYKNYKSKETVLVITVGCIVLYLVFKNRVFLYCALVIGLAGVLSFYLSEKIDWVWGKLSFHHGRDHQQNFADDHFPAGGDAGGIDPPVAEEEQSYLLR